MDDHLDPKPVTRVVDPGLSAEARNRLLRKIGRSNSEAADAAGGSGGCLGIIGIVTLFVLHFATGLSWWWMFAGALPIVLGIVLASALSDQLDDRDQSHFVKASDLDVPSRKLMLRVQKAITGVLKSGAYASNLPGHAVDEPTLRRHEWEIAAALRKISSLRAEHQASAESAGPMTAAVLAPQRRALAVAADATTSRITALENYAAELTMADNAERDWQAAMKASGRNDQYIDLLAATAADEHAIAEIKGLTSQAAAAAEVFQEHLYKASLAAQILVFPAALPE